ncbi:MGMT family protein [Bacillus sp. FJAT-42376]|uniref:MGMT family protein n=1 Tax=Bacillus sp. FJAT-42376 TaxID=2014076 RepID=UPI000F5070F1|nr:MGMT family protein [Bacillus sp. FJAT-42376]AZB44116.1 MGMT family protein [Bacillus sp. FJAT-42376]
MEPFTERVIHILRNIPEGKVMTYGQIAFAAGSPRAARQVVRILHSMSRKHNLPWHRVINSKGELSIKDEHVLERQQKALTMEGVIINDGKKIDLEKYQYKIQN